MDRASDQPLESVGQDLEIIARRLIEEAAVLTQSKLAYFAVTNDAVTELTMIAWSRNAMEECRMHEMPRIYPVEATGLWGDCIREGGAVITNDYENCTRKTKKGYPVGHVPVKRHLNVPVMADGKVKGILGVGNKEAEYTEKDAALLQAFANAAWPSVARAKARAGR